MKRFLTVAAAVAAGAVGGAVAANPPNFNLPWRAPLKSSSYTGTRTTVTWALATYTDLLLETPSVPRPTEDFDVTRVRCHGGVARVTWYVGNLEPNTATSGIHISVFMDGRIIASLLKGGNHGIWEDAPASVETVVRCPAGLHVFSVRAGQAVTSTWGMPYANSNDRVQRGFIVEEVWNPKR
jgi:hypothetical protein